MHLYKTFSILTLIVMMTSCGTTKQTTATYWVNSAKVDCDAGAGKTTCLQVTTADNHENAEWSNFYAPINGFTFEPGFLQKIEVTETKLDSENVPADASSIQYDLVKVLEKITDPKLAIHDIWVATHINGKEIDRTKAPNLEINTTEMRVFGSNGCNNYNGQIKTLTSKTIAFGPIASTRKMCLDMAIPDSYDKALYNTSSYKKDDLTLTFYDENGGEVLRFNKVD
ncbi:DUF4377 domain-containing protein [Winogradskyella pulchriflava]|uniref:DUF4377 domain-containing protein n=1 Tax=Winogradskyella pulchriflava TaxID=1110688 RepID=A0ABV6QC42_9FLAO